MSERLPITTLVIIWLLLDRFQVGPLGLGIFYGLGGFAMVACVIATFQQKTVDIFKEHT